MIVLWHRGEPILIPPQIPRALSPVRINNRHQILFEAGVLWNRGTFTDFELPPGGIGVAEDLNDFGESVGHTAANAETRAALWDEDGSLEGLGVPPGFQHSLAAALNDRREVVGTAFGATERAALWRRGTWQILPFIQEGDLGSTARDINFWGHIVGFERIPGQSDTAAVLWMHGRAFKLQSLIRKGDPLAPYVTLIQAQRINDWGQILALGLDSRSPAGFVNCLLTPVWR